MKKLVMTVLEGMALVCLISTLVFAENPSKPKVTKGQIVDSGSFGVFVGGRRVATEKFQIEQRADESVTSSELELADGTSKPTQQSELEMAPDGTLVRYTWHLAGPEKQQAVVEPSNEFLVEHVLTGASQKSADTPFLMPHSTIILDDNFFSHRQVLAWRYLASGCAPNPKGQVECNLPKSQYGVIVPQQRLSMQVEMEFAGKDKVMIRGALRELNRIDIHAEDGDWSMWLDDSNKVVRMTISGTNTEILRD